MKRFTIILTIIMLMSGLSRVYGATDEMIFKDLVANTYTGRAEAADMISNLNFSDVPADSAAKEAIVRSGALNMIKGYGKNFLPNNAVSNQEAIAFVLRAIGMESRSQQTGVQVQGQMPPESSLRTLWSIGYLNVAAQIGLLTWAQYNDALVADQSTLDPAVNFVRGAAVTREQLADWLVKGLQVVNTDAFATTATQQKIYTFSDWESIAADFVDSVESATAANIITGDGGRFRPKSSVTRSEMAQILENMDSIYYNLTGIVKKTGTVAGISDAQSTATATAELSRNVYIRTVSGGIDVLQYQIASNSSPQSANLDAVVYKDSQVMGLPMLVEGDQIEYLIRDDTKTVLYVEVTNSPLVVNTIQGSLISIDSVNKTITISDANNKIYTYPFVEGIMDTIDDVTYLIVSEARRKADSLPRGSKYELTLKNNIVSAVRYLGEPVLVSEIKGIVTENDPDMGYLAMIDNNGNEIIKYYNEGSLKVKKTQYYDQGDSIGYISEMFTNFKYDPRETDISDIEPGDIVFIRTDPDDPDYIVNISASTNYVARYGKIKQFTTSGNISSMLIEYEDKQTAWYDVTDGIFISKAGRPSGPADVVVGDWTKILVNQAIISPGYVMESVKEMNIEGEAHHISNIIKGQLSGINSIQNQLVIQNAQTLAKTGWSNYKQIAQFSIAGKDIEYYYDGKRITLDYALKYLKRADGDIYIALENNYAGEKVKKVTFRNSRDELLSPDTVVSADGNGNFNIVSNAGAISTDQGTIVRRHGRLVEGQNIMIPDYAVVSLNGGNTAAVVDITEAPGTSAVMIARGRVQSVDEGKSFQVQSMAILSGSDWNYTPVQRVFTIDYNTLFLNSGGYVPNEDFIGYTENSAVDKVYNIVIDGSRAARVVDSPYAFRAVRGTIYSVDGTSASLKNASYYDNNTGQWRTVSNTNATINVTIPANAIIVKNNAVIAASGLQIGDQIKVMTDTLPTIAPGMNIDGYILLVEK